MSETSSIAQRFWARVEKRGPDECWPWKAGINHNGYGLFRTGSRRDDSRKAVLAHRMSFQLEHGRLPAPCALHRCDNPSCVNPAHLFEGTRADNMADMRAKERARSRPLRGEENPKTKLTEAAVETIRTLRGLVSQRRLAKIYGVAQPTIYKIQKRLCWRPAP